MADVRPLLRYRAAGAGFVGVNVGYAPQDSRAALAIVRGFRDSIAATPALAQAATAGDVTAAHADGRLAVAFDLEDSAPLDGRLGLVETFHELGVRSLIPTYNRNNAAGSGCLDADDTGLTRYGRDLVAELNRVGMVADGSHCGARTGLDMCAVTTAPMVYSHSCMRAVWDHPRNITDEQARECAATGGVIGITGVGIFLGANEATVELMLRHIDHAVALVGPEHVGIGSDFPFDHADLNRELAENPQVFDESFLRWGPLEFVAPEPLGLLGSALSARGYPADAVSGILGGNFLRVARQVWPG